MYLNSSCPGAGCAGTDIAAAHTLLVDLAVSECERVASGEGKITMQLRGIHAADFEETLKDVSPSTPADSFCHARAVPMEHAVW